MYKLCVYGHIFRIILIFIVLLPLLLTRLTINDHIHIGIIYLILSSINTLKPKSYKLTVCCCACCACCVGGGGCGGGCCAGCITVGCESTWAGLTSCLRIQTHVISILHVIYRWFLYLLVTRCTLRNRFAILWDLLGIYLYFSVKLIVLDMAWPHSTCSTLILHLEYSIP